MNAIKKMLVAVLVTASVFNCSAQKANTDDNQLANKGYDVVNYFTTNTAQRGSASFSATNNESTYYFINAENLEAFKANPSQYLPQYDGYCAFAVAKMNKKVAVDPETFRIDDGKLYLFFNDYFDGTPFNTIIPWINNEASLEKLAIANWKTLKDQ